MELLETPVYAAPMTKWAQFIERQLGRVGWTGARLADEAGFNKSLVAAGRIPLPKLHTRVRFPSSAPGQGMFRGFGLSLSCAYRVSAQLLVPDDGDEEAAVVAGSNDCEVAAPAGPGVVAHVVGSPLPQCVVCQRIIAR